jgi:peroxiredoxin
MTRRGWVCLSLVLAAMWAVGGRNPFPAGAAEPARAVALGDKVPDSHSLRDLHGNRRPLQGFAGHKALVLVFLGADCPLSNLYAPGLVELEKRYRSKNVQFLAIYPNEHEDLDQVAGHASDRDVPFPVLKDFGQRLADLAGVTRVPTAVVLDDTFSLRYRGRINDRYGAATRRPAATREDLAEAIDDVLAGKAVRVAQTEADGCLLDRAGTRPVKAGVTYARDVAPILQKRCQGCHRPGQSAPFVLQTYEDAVRHAAMIKEVTAQRRMPPWHADPRFGHFASERRLSAAEIDTLASWADGGLARGDDKDLPAPIDWPKGWVHGTPDLVISMPEEFEVPADGVLDYKNWIIDPHFTEDKWVTIAEARPGAAGVVHHIVAYILRPGQRQPVSPDGSISVLVGWAPGDLGMVCPPDTALRIPKGSRLRFEMHYTPNGKAVKDRSAIGLTFARQPPRHELFIDEFANTWFEVPPGNPHFKAEAGFKFRSDARILSFAPHMHWRGKDYRYEMITPDGKQQTLLSVPRWDFNWQSVYRLQEPVRAPKGTRLRAIAHWDNSANNPLNPDPKKSAPFGLQTWEEMMVGFVAYVFERPEEAAAQLAKSPPGPAQRLFDRLDLNGDDVLSSDEIPLRLQPLLLSSGYFLPQKISRDEFSKMIEGMRHRMQKSRPGPRAGKDQDRTPAPQAGAEKGSPGTPRQK